MSDNSYCFYASVNNGFPNCIYYSPNTGSGDSGGPIFDDAQDIIVGLHTSGNEYGVYFYQDFYFFVKHLKQGGNI